MGEEEEGLAIGGESCRGDYGAVERMSETEPAKVRTRSAVPKFIAPILAVVLISSACVVVSAFFRADRQMSQVIFLSPRPLVCVVRSMSRAYALLASVCVHEGFQLAMSPCFVCDERELAGPVRF